MAEKTRGEMLLEARARRRAVEEYDRAVSEMDRMVDRLSPTLQERIEAAGRNWWVKPSVLADLIDDAATMEDFDFVGSLAAQVGDDTLTENVEEARKIAERRIADEGFQWGDLLDPVKGTVRLGGSLIESGWQEVQGLFRNAAVGYASGRRALQTGSDLAAGRPVTGLGVAQDAPRSRFAGALGNVIQGEGANVGSQSSFGITLGKIFEGEIGVSDLFFGSEEALGHGWMTGGAVAEEQRSRAWRAAHIGERSLTPGRLVAYSAFEPGTAAYNTLSGFIDAGLVVTLDPANLALGGVGKGVKAGRYFQPEEASKVKRVLGLVDGQRRTVTDAVDHWLGTRPGQRFVERIARMTDPTDIWEASRRQIPVEWAVQLADTTDQAVTTDLLRGFLGTRVTRKPVGWHYTPAGVAVRRFTNRSPLFGQMPRSGMLDTYDPDAVVAQYADELKNAHVPEEVRRDLTARAMRAATSGPPGVPLASDRYTILTAVKDAVKAQLRASGVDADKSAQLNRIWDSYESLRSYNIDVMTGREKPLPNVLLSAGDEVPAPTPETLEQLLGRWVPLPDPRTLREVSRRTSKLAGMPGGQKVATAEVMAGLAADAVYRMWKPLQLIRIAYIARVVGDEQARMAVAGHSSLFSSPLSYLALAIMDDGRLGKVLDDIPGVTVGRYGADVTGARFTRAADGKFISRMEADDPDGVLANTLYAGTTELLFGKTQKFRPVKGFVPIRRTEQGFHEAWLDEVRFLHDNQIARRFAEGATVDDLKDWYWSSSYRAAAVGSGDVARFTDEAGQEVAERLSPLARQVQTRAGADAYVDHMVDWVEDVTRGDPGLLGAVASGRIGDGATHAARGTKVPVGTAIHRNFRPDRRAVDYVRSLDEAGVAPEFVRGSPALTERVEAGEIYRSFIDMAMDMIAVRPSNWASRSPEFRQSYWDRVEDLLDLATPQTRDEILRVAAEEARLPRAVIKRLERIQANGALDLEDINALASQYAADQTKRLLYDLHNRSRFFDAFRVIFPFGEAWKEVLTTWGRLLSENPKSLRTLQRNINAARGAGIVYTDDKTGEEMFTIPGSKALVSAFTKADLPILGEGSTTALPGDFRAPLSGLSIAGSVIPGFGPAVQWAVGTFLPDKPEWNWVRNIAFQYGGENQGLLKTFTPGWAEKLQSWLSSPDSDRMLNTAIGESLDALAATGDYDLSSPLDRERLQDDAVEAGRRIMLLRGVLQFIAPSAPSQRTRVSTKQGEIMPSVLREEFGRLQQFDYETAVPTFIERFGPEALLAAVPYTETRVEGRPVFGMRPTKQFSDFERTHEALFDLYPNVAGLLGPQDPGFDFQVYERHSRRGRRLRSVQERLDDYNDMLARYAFDRLKSNLPAYPTPAQRRWLADKRNELIQAYPGYNPKDFNPGDLAGAIDKLRLAAAHPSVEGDEVAEAVRAYFALRDKVQDSAPSSGWQTAKGARPYREWLRRKVDEIAGQVPEFRRVWDIFLSREMDDDVDVEIGEAAA